MVGEHQTLQKEKRKVLHYRHEVADAHNVVQHSWWVVLLHGSNVERAGGSCNSNWCGQECWCKEGWRDLKWFMVSGWISLNVEPKTYRTGEDTASSQLREQGRKPPPCCSVIVLYNTLTRDLRKRLVSVVSKVIRVNVPFFYFELICFIKCILFILFFCNQISLLLPPLLLFFI